MVAMQPKTPHHLESDPLAFDRKLHALCTHYGRGPDFINLPTFSASLDLLYAEHKQRLDGLMIEVTWAQQFRRRIGPTALTMVITLLGFEAYRFAAVHARKYAPRLDSEDVQDAATATLVDIDRRLQLKPRLHVKEWEGGFVENRLSVFTWDSYSDFCRTVNISSANKVKDVIAKRNSRPRQTGSGVLDATACHDDPAWLTEQLRRYETATRES